MSTDSDLPEHHTRCGVCGIAFDMRKSDQVFAHEHGPLREATGIRGQPAKVADDSIWVRCKDCGDTSWTGPREPNVCSACGAINRRVQHHATYGEMPTKVVEIGCTQPIDALHKEEVRKIGQAFLKNTKAFAGSPLTEDLKAQVIEWFLECAKDIPSRAPVPPGIPVYENGAFIGYAEYIGMTDTISQEDVDTGRLTVDFCYKITPSYKYTDRSLDLRNLKGWTWDKDAEEFTCDHCVLVLSLEYMREHGSMHECSGDK